MTPDAQSALARGREYIRIEIEALQTTADALDESFVRVMKAIEATQRAGRKLIFSGVGKSAHIAQKLAGTFNSTGVTSCFLDATQALHGDLGLCAAGDLAVLLSNSGQSAELLRLLAMLKRFELTIVALTSNPDSELARGADLQLLYRVPREACPLRLAPTASTTAAMALGDALAMVLLERRGFTREDFARLHPAGNLGTALLVKVKDIMRVGDRLPVMPDHLTVQDAILGMTKAKAGSIALIDESTAKLTGILTDGDFRRHVLTSPGFLSQPVRRFMTRTPKTVHVDALAVEALRIFDRFKIDDLIVVDDAGRPVGLVDVQDLPKMKLM
jgi:arabinose-5-phosphate isomerase